MANFLCPNHRQWVLNNIDQALQTTYANQQKANELLHEGKTREALNYYGCAYEVVEICIQIKGNSDHQQLSRLTTLCLQTAQCFFELNAFSEERAMLDRTITILKLEENRSLVPESLASFKKYCIASLNECLSYATYYVQRYNRVSALH